MFRVVLYARTSTEEERQSRALDTQIGELRELVKNTEDWNLVDEYIDQSSGTTSKGRKEFNRLIEDLSTDKFDIVLIKDQDRLMRDEYLWYLFRNELLTNNKRLFIKMEGRFYIPESDGLLTGVKAIIAAQYSRDLSRKINQAHKTRMKKGTVVTNGRMWGYDQKDAKLIINEKEAEVVRYVFSSYIAGKGFRTIANELTDMGITSSKGTEFSITTLKRMIRQEKYKGTLICGKKTKNFYTKTYDDIPKSEWVIHEDSENVPPIVSKEIWDEANGILKSKVKHYNLDKPKGYFSGTYTLSGKIVCGKCGSKYYHSISRRKKKDGTQYEFSSWMCKKYRIYGKNSSYGCDNKQVKDSVIDEAIRTVIFEMWKDKDKSIDKIIDALKNTIGKSDNNSILTSIKEDIKKLMKKKDKLLELYTDDLISMEDFKLKNDEISNRIQMLNNRSEELWKRSLQSPPKREPVLS